ncbi:T9SS type A sorting domain-containing protein [Pedobacter montanisoli]|uniref:T9SS type A sorting domain-containing protein n=1 Tax=Pedobacter montanisoli TaxID=2923277 RepID=A0ABS9ZVK7_9SPHI|nr:T9SS type A sorting domain-containing protein [Pedobacter montanisoli]MCJ0742169.1 T9SS type A sorting domain-containing protein [Pedobacter montanisoli]
MNFQRLALLLFCWSVATASAQVTISSGTNFVINTGANVILNDLSLNYGSSNLVNNGNLIFTGNSDNTIAGSSALNKFTLAKSFGKKLMLGNQLSLTGSVDLSIGILDLNGYNLNLGTTGQLLNENAASYVTGNSGYIIATANLNAPQSVNPGNIGVVLTSSSNWGNTTIRRGNYALSDGTHQTIKRFFEIEPTLNTNLNATIRFNYLDMELNGLQESQLKLLYSDNNGTTWNNLTSATINTAQSYIEVSNVNTMGQFSAANDFTTLPISAINLSGISNNSKIVVKWSTLNEINVDYFIIEKSIDRSSFKEIARMASKSNVSANNDYSIEDKSPVLGANYYRIRGIDKNGDETTSGILAVPFSLTKDQTVSIYPNPTAKLIKASYYAYNNQPVTLSVISNSGKTEFSKVFPIISGLNELPLDVSLLPAGVYYLKISNITFNKSIKFIKN